MAARRGWQRWTRGAASAFALVWCAVIVVGYLFARTMKAAFEQDDTAARWCLLLIVPAATGAILIHRRPATGVAALFVAALGAGAIALVTNGSVALVGLPFAMAAVLAMIEPRPLPAPGNDPDRTR